MVILSDPPLIRPFESGEDFFISAVSWRDRMRFYYTSDGVIKTRDFDDWRSTPVRFRAVVGRAGSRSLLKQANKKLTLTDPPSVKLVIRAARLFDGTSNDYKHDLDILVDGRLTVSRKGGLLAKLLGRPWPSAEDVLTAVRDAMEPAGR